jgi:hypothetical protein
MASCDILYFDPTQVGQSRQNPAGHPLGPASDGWQPCTAPGQVWTDPELVLRWVCTRHRRQLIALHAAGRAAQVRWQRPGLATSPAPAQSSAASAADR